MKLSIRKGGIVKSAVRIVLLMGAIRYPARGYYRSCRSNRNSNDINNPIGWFYDVGSYQLEKEK